MIDKPLEQYTVSDFVDAKTNMNSTAWKRLLRIAKAGGIEVPGFLTPRNGRIVFVTESSVAMYQRTRDTEAVAQFNAQVKAWGLKVEAELKTSANSRFKHQKRYVDENFPRLSDSISLNLRFDREYRLETRSVGFRMARHGVFAYYGAGKHYGGVVGSKWTDRYRKEHTTNPLSLGLMGTGSRDGEDWFNSIIENNISELADIVANYSSEITLNMSGILIPE